MQHTWMVLLAALVLFSSAAAPAGIAQASSAECPDYDLVLSKDPGVFDSLSLECLRIYKELSREANISAQAQTVAPATVSGPDAFGYFYDDTVSYNWVSAATNSSLTGDDQFTGPIHIGFSFPFYGISQTQLYVSTNGLITFGAGSTDYGGYGKDVEERPDNLIAPYWDDLILGSPYNNGTVYYSRGGSAPERYFVVEWRGVDSIFGSAVPISFEAILYENGDIVFQYQSLPDDSYSLVRIEDSVGSESLSYLGTLGASKAVRFYYPAAATARLVVSPARQAGGFAPIDGSKEFPIAVLNPGTLGADTYDLTSASAWPVTFFASDDVTPLADTDGDGLTDTGPILQGASTTVIARVTTPDAAQVGDHNQATLTVISSLNASKIKTIDLFTSIPADFTTVFQEESDGAMSVMNAGLTGITTAKVTADHYLGRNVAVTNLANGNYLYAWEKHYRNESYPLQPWVDDIEYMLFDRSGNVVLPVTRLTRNVGATTWTSDGSPSVAQAPDGTIGVVWSRYLKVSSTGQFNQNIYFATLDPFGSPLTSPINITGNTSWGVYGDMGNPYFGIPTIATTDDNRFVIAWEEYHVGQAGSRHNIGIAVHETSGRNVFPPHAITADDRSYLPVLNSLTGGRVILTWSSMDVDAPLYTVIDSAGTVLDLSGNDLFYDTSSHADAVQLPNGKVAIAWPTYTGVRLAILDSAYAIESESGADTPIPAAGDALSVTTDAFGHIIITWVTGEYHDLYYALADSTGAFLTPPMLYQTSGNPIETSWNGQGIAPYDTRPLLLGNAGIARAMLSYTDGAPRTVRADAKGNYSIRVPDGWSGTVTPSKMGYAFTPAERIYNNVDRDQTGQDYDARYVGGEDTTGVFRPDNGLLYLKNTNETGFADMALNYGLGGDYPVVGDWDGNGTVTIGIYRDGYFYLRNENTIGFAEVVFPFGQAGDQPIAGDWNGDGVDTIGIFHPSTGQFLLRNSSTEGPAEMSFYLGNPGDVGLAGDWDGDGLDTTGVFRPSNGLLYLKNKNETGFADAALNYGLPGDRPVTGDWDGNGVDTIGVYRDGLFYLRNENTIGFAEVIFGLGNPGDMPIAGNWDGLP